MSGVAGGGREVLEDIAGNTDPISDDVVGLKDTGNIQIDPATSGNQTTEIGHLSEIEGAVETLETTVATISATPLLRMAIFDNNDTQITTFGGGTQYTEGDIDTTITGTAIMWEDTSDTLRVASAAKPLPVAIISGAGSGGTASADDADFTAGTTSGTPAMGVYESSPTSVTDGDMGIVGITQTRQLRTSSAQEGTWNITNISGTISLPTGAATAANQQTDALTDTELRATPVPVSGTVTANAGTNLNTSALALETGGNLATIAGKDFATSAKQDTIIGHVDGIETLLGTTNSTLGTIDTDTGNIATYTTSLQYLHTEDYDTGAGTDTTAAIGLVIPSNSGAVSVSSTNPLPTNLYVNGNTIDTNAGNSSANTIRTVIASDQVAIPITDNAGSLTVDGTVAATQSGTWNITNISGTVSLPTGASTLAEQQTQTAHLATIAGDTTSLDAKDLMLGTDFSAVFGVNTLLTTTQADSRVNTTDTFTVNAWGQYFNGTTWDRMRGDSTDGLLVNLGTNNDVSVSNTVTVDGSGVTQPISAASLPLPTGAATETTLDAVKTAVETIDNAISGTEMQVDVVASLPAGTNNIGKVVLTDGTDDATIRDVTGAKALDVSIVDGSGNQITSFGGGTEYTEDVATANPIVGKAILMERDDALSTVTPIEGDWIGLRGTAEGALWTQDFNSDAILTAAQAIQTAVEGTLTVGSHAVTNAGTFAVQAAQSGSWTVDLGATDNAVLDTIASPVATISATPLQRVAIFDASDTQITSFGGGTQYTEDDAAAANPVGTAPILVRADTPSTVTSANGDNVAQRGTNYGAAYVQVVDSSGNFVNSFGGSAAGDVAHDAADSGNPVKIGYKAIAHGTNPTAVAVNDRTDSYANRHGIPWVIGGHPNIKTLEASYSAAQTNTAIVTVSSGTKIVVTQIKVINDALSPNIIDYRIGFATATTPTTTGVVATNPGMIPGYIDNRGDGSGILGVGADDEDLRITLTDPGTSGEARVLVSYYTIES